MASRHFNPVGYLQEFVQKNNIEPPKYVDMASSGKDHCKTFEVECTFQNFKVIGSAPGKKLAKTEAARAMITKLEEIDFFKNFVQNSPEPKQALSHKSSISRLQEFCMRPNSGLPIPVYNEDRGKGVKGGFGFKCEVSEKITTGQGSTKKMAKEESALKMCIELGIVDASETDSISEVSEDHSEDSTDYSSASVAVSPKMPEIKNPIATLQELCQSRRMPLPQYVEKGQAAGQFVMGCTVGEVTVEGSGGNKKAAKTQAAHKCLKQVMQMPVYSVQKREAVPIPEWTEKEREAKEEAKSEVIEKLTDFNVGEAETSVQKREAVVDLPQSPIQEWTENEGEAKEEDIEKNLQSKEEAKREEVLGKELTAIICMDEPRPKVLTEEEAEMMKERMELIDKYLFLDSDNDDPGESEDLANGRHESSAAS